MGKGNFVHVGSIIPLTNTIQDSCGLKKKKKKSSKCQMMEESSSQLHLTGKKNKGGKKKERPYKSENGKCS